MRVHETHGVYYIKYIRYIYICNRETGTEIMVSNVKVLNINFTNSTY